MVRYVCVRKVRVQTISQPTKRKVGRLQINGEVLLMSLSSLAQIQKFNELYLTLHKSFRDATFVHSQKYGFTVPQMTLIFELYLTPNLMLNELCARIGLSKSTTSSLVERMESKGIVSREIPKENRRSVRLSLTPEFIAEHQEILSLKDHIISDLFKFESLSAQEAEQINDVVGKLNALLVVSIKELTAAKE